MPPDDNIRGNPDWVPEECDDDVREDPFPLTTGADALEWLFLFGSTVLCVAFAYYCLS